MDNSNSNQNAGQSAREGTGYSTPGQDQIVQSTSAAVPSPSETSAQRLTTPKGHLQSINEQPGDANPALQETIGEEQGQVSTADLLRARETAEEARLREAQAQIYQDASPDQIDREFSRTDSGQPEFPFGYQEDASPRSIDSPDVQQDFESASGGVGSMNIRARAESMVERDGRETSYTDALHGEGPFGRRAQELDAEGPEMTNTFVPGDDVVRDMKNIPDEG
jgi:hypothetical protein